ncbi:MAG: hypothetical protein QUV07_05040 [Cyanobium sp. CZS 25K]|nr:hypothetical protein [Cyanobium sp. CZS25K]
MIGWPGSRWRGCGRSCRRCCSLPWSDRLPQLSVGDAAQYACLASLLALFVGLVFFLGA